MLAGLLTAGPDLIAARPGQTLIATKNYYGAAFEAAVAGAGIRLLRPAASPPGQARACSSPCARSSNRSTFKGQFDLEQHGGHSPGGVIVRVLQRILALNAAIWHNGAPATHCP